MIGLTPWNFMTHLLRFESAGRLSPKGTGNGVASRTWIWPSSRGRAPLDTHAVTLSPVLAEL
jgi:hypothetical protein